MIAWLFGLVRYLENNLSAGLAFTCSYLLIPLLYSLYLQYTTEDMNGRRRLVSYENLLLYCFAYSIPSV